MTAPASLRAEPAGITRRYLHDEVAGRLRTLIRDGGLEPRARINEADLCARFGISRTPLREAIKILATEGLLELLPNRGARVGSISEAELDYVLDVISILERRAGELAAARITPDEIAAISRDHDAMVEAWKREDEGAYFVLNRQIHDAIMAAARSPTLAQVYANLSGRVQRARYTAHKTPDQWLKAVREHEDMLRLLKAGASKDLGELMRRHVLGKRPVIAAAFG